MQTSYFDILKCMLATTTVRHVSVKDVVFMNVRESKLNFSRGNIILWESQGTIRFRKYRSVKCDSSYMQNYFALNNSMYWKGSALQHKTIVKPYEKNKGE